MIDFEAVIADLERTRSRPRLFIDPVTPESLLTYLSGLQRGLRLINQTLTDENYVDAGQIAVTAVGARRTALHPLSQWRGEGLEDHQIIEKMIDLEIEYLRQLSAIQDQKPNL